MKVVAGIQARMSSKRFPNKMLVSLLGKPLIARVVERVRRAKLVDMTVVLTSTDPSDDPLVEYCQENGIPYRRGSLLDVLSRYGDLIDEFQPDYIVRVCGDCPLIEPAYIDSQIQGLYLNNADLTVWRKDLSGTLGGQGVFSRWFFNSAQLSTDPRDREHAGAFWMSTHAHLSNSFIENPTVESLYYRSGLRLQVDEKPDLELMWDIFMQFDGRPFTTLQALWWLDRHPEVRKLNAHVKDSLDNQALRRL